MTIRQKKLACYFTLVVLLLGCTVTKSIQRRTAPISGDFGYEFCESTGPNQFIFIDNQEVPIDFDVQHSDKKSLKLLHSLKWNVLCQNGSGKEITLKGTYSPQTGRFILKAWSIVVPFKYIDVLSDESVQPPDIKIVTRLGLRDSDFEHGN